jgi:DNA repair ATPase RecN
MNLDSLINSLTKKLNLLSQVDLAIINQIGGSDSTNEDCDKYNDLAGDFQTAIEENIEIYNKMEKKIQELQDKLNNNDLQTRNDELTAEISELKLKINEDGNLKKIEELTAELDSIKKNSEKTNTLANGLEEKLNQCRECKNKYKEALENINGKLSNLQVHNKNINK